MAPLISKWVVTSVVDTLLTKGIEYISELWQDEEPQPSKGRYRGDRGKDNTTRRNYDTSKFTDKEIQFILEVMNEYHEYGTVYKFRMKYWKDVYNYLNEKLGKSKHRTVYYRIWREHMNGS